MSQFEVANECWEKLKLQNVQPAQGRAWNPLEQGQVFLWSCAGPMCQQGSNKTQGEDPSVLVGIAYVLSLSTTAHYRNKTKGLSLCILTTLRQSPASIVRLKAGIVRLSLSTWLTRGLHLDITGHMHNHWLSYTNSEWPFQDHYKS